MEFRIYGKKFRFIDGRVEYFYKDKWQSISKANSLKEAMERAKYYALCTMV